MTKFAPSSTAIRRLRTAAVLALAGVGAHAWAADPPSFTFDPSQVAGYDVATGTWNSDASYDLDADQDYAETEQL